MPFRPYWVKERHHLNRIVQKQTIATTTVVARVPHKHTHTPTHAHTNVERTLDQGGRDHIIVKAANFQCISTRLSGERHLTANFINHQALRLSESLHFNTPGNPQPAKSTPGLAARLVRAPCRSRHCYCGDLSIWIGRRSNGTSSSLVGGGGLYS